MNDVIKKPDFLIIGAQKCGTTWLWNMLKQHPGTDLRNPKEIQFFSSSRNYRKGMEWYYSHFRNVNPVKVNGEASTDYFFDHVLIDNIRQDEDLPLIPVLVQNELPDVKIILILRDPVKRAVSAYYHHLQWRRFPPGVGLIEASERFPHLRIIERGFYAKYLKAWLERFPKERILSLIFEKHVLKSREDTLVSLYSFLGLDQDFIPRNVHRSKNERWGKTHTWLNFYLGPWYGFIYRQLNKTFLTGFLRLFDDLKVVPLYDIPDSDIEMLKRLYKSEKEELEHLLKIDLNEWQI